MAELEGTVFSPVRQGRGAQYSVDIDPVAGGITV